MSRWGALEHGGITELRDPLLVVSGVAGVGWDEYVTIRLLDGSDRHGVVLEVDGDLAVVQVLEGTDGLDPGRIRVRFSGAPLHIPVGDGWLGRVCNGRGVPIDGGPPVHGTTSAATNGAPLNPLMRQPPADPVLTGVSAIDRAGDPGPWPEAAHLLRGRPAAPGSWPRRSRPRPTWEVSPSPWSSPPWA